MKNDHGGQRAGAGAPKKINAKKIITFRIAPEAIEHLKAQGNQSAFIEKLILAHKNNTK